MNERILIVDDEKEITDLIEVLNKLKTIINEPLIFKGSLTFFKAISAILLLIYYFW